MDLVNANHSSRQVPFRTSVQYAAKHLGLKEEDALELCHEISSKDDSEGGVDALFASITQRLVLDSEATDLARSRNDHRGRGDPSQRVHIADKSAGQSSPCC